MPTPGAVNKFVRRSVEMAPTELSRLETADLNVWMSVAQDAPNVRVWVGDPGRARDHAVVLCHELNGDAELLLEARLKQTLGRASAWDHKDLAAWKRLKVHFLKKQRLDSVLGGIGHLGRTSAKQIGTESEWPPVLQRLQAAGFRTFCRLTTAAPSHLDLGEFLFDLHTRYWEQPLRRRTVRLDDVDKMARQERRTAIKLAAEDAVSGSERQLSNPVRETIFVDRLVIMLANCVWDSYRNTSGPSPKAEECLRRRTSLELGAKRMIDKLSSGSGALSPVNVVRNIPRPFVDWYGHAVGSNPRPSRATVVQALKEFRDTLSHMGPNEDGR
jgi:hypothetical protein